VNVAVRDGVGANAKGTPLFRDRLGESNYCSLGSGIVGLTDISVKTRSRGNVDDGTICRRSALLNHGISSPPCDACRVAKTTHLDPEIRRGCSHEAERSTYVNLHDNVVSVVRHGVEHLVIREASYIKITIIMRIRVCAIQALCRTVVHDVMYLAECSDERRLLSTRTNES